MVDGPRIDFVVEQENFNTYALADGTRLRVKHVITRIVRTADNGDGSPNYSFNMSPVCDVEPPVLRAVPQKEKS